MKYLANYIDHLNEKKHENVEFIDKIRDFLDKNDIEGKKDKVKAKDLMPGQKDIFLDEIIYNLLGKKKFVKKCLKGKLKDKEILISSDNHIIDGHHRWASAFILNPDCEIKCTKINLTLKEAISVLNELVKEINAGNQGQSGNFKYNIFNIVESDDKEELKKTIKKIFKKYDTESEKKFIKLIEKEEIADSHPINHLINNIYSIPTPEHKLHPRKDMPQMSENEIEEILK